MMKRALLLPLALAACSGLSREARIERKLEQVGMKPGLARCMAHKLDEKLSDDELSRLAEAAHGATPPDGGHLKLGALADRLRAVDDPHIVDVVSRAGLGCTLLG